MIDFCCYNTRLSQKVLQYFGNMRHNSTASGAFT